MMRGVIGGCRRRRFERRVLLFCDAQIEANVRLLHDVPRTGIEQDGLFVELGQLGGTDADECDAVLAVRVEAGVGEALAVVLAKEAALGQHNVVDLVARTLAVKRLPFFARHLTLPSSPFIT